MEEEPTLVEIIGLAIRSEEDAADFYGRMSKLIKNELVRKKYESLAKEEVGHRHMLVELYKKMTGETLPPPGIPGKPQTAEAGEPSMTVNSIEELLNFAISRERKAFEFYQTAARRVANDNARRVFEHLSGIERGHETLLKSELESYLKNKNWYADKPDIQLVGP